MTTHGQNNRPSPAAQDTTALERGEVIPYASLHVEHVDWLVPGLIPLGMLSVVAGEQGLGKSLLHAAWASGLSQAGTPSILVSAEDSPTHTTKARLMAAQAKQQFVYHAAMLPVLGNGDGLGWLDRIVGWIEETGARLLVLDPLSAFMSAQSDSYKDQHVRLVLAALDAVARATRCAIVYVMHLTKGAGTNPLQRISGSVAFTAAARSVVLVTPETEPREPGRIVAHVKCNVAELASPQRWEVEPILLPDIGGRDVRTARIVYKGIADVDTYSLLAPRLDSAEATELAEATQLITTALLAGAILSSDLERTVRDTGVSSRTYDRARRMVGVRAFQRDRKWYTELVTSQDANGQDAKEGWRPDESRNDAGWSPQDAKDALYKEGWRPEAESVSQSPSLDDLGSMSLDDLRELFPEP